MKSAEEQNCSSAVCPILIIETDSFLIKLTYAGLTVEECERRRWQVYGL